MPPLYPLRFEPILRHYIWGGRRLEKVLGKQLAPGEDYAESWEIADCGGGLCPGCPLGKSCVVDTDCMSLACDAVKLVCIGNSCADHRQDHEETDVDCGGCCTPCNLAARCDSDRDCQSGRCEARGSFDSRGFGEESPGSLGHGGG